MKFKLFNINSKFIDFEKNIILFFNKIQVIQYQQYIYRLKK
jgi:hypothetical protein